jgi:hypothetical protein
MKVYIILSYDGNEGEEVEDVFKDKEMAETEKNRLTKRYKGYKTYRMVTSTVIPRISCKHVN